MAKLHWWLAIVPVRQHCTDLTMEFRNQGVQVNKALVSKLGTTKCLIWTKSIGTSWHSIRWNQNEEYHELCMLNLRWLLFHGTQFWTVKQAPSQGEARTLLYQSWGLICVPSFLPVPPSFAVLSQPSPVSYLLRNIEKKLNKVSFIHNGCFKTNISRTRILA